MAATAAAPRGVKFADNVIDNEPQETPQNQSSLNDMSAPSTTDDILMKQDLATLDVAKLTPITPEVISRQATINIGTIGHVAHGKSTVVKAISETNTVRFKNELERNITIKLGYANAKVYEIDLETLSEELRNDPDIKLRDHFYISKKSSTPDRFSVGSKWVKNPKMAQENFGPDAEYKCVRHVSFVDCPGHDVLMSTMLTGAAVMDAALLLIAADQPCPQTQTNEHLCAIELMKLKHIIVLQNKVDLITMDEALEHQKSIADFLQDTVAEGSPIIPISAQMQMNVDIVCQYMTRNIPLPLRDFTSEPRLIVIRSFDNNKPGTSIDQLQGGVAGGSILHGVFRVGDEIEIRPGNWFRAEDNTLRARPFRTRITDLFSEKNSLQYAVPGGLIGVGTTLDPSVCQGDGLVGNILARPGNLPPVYQDIEMTFHLLKKLAGARTEEKGKLKIKALAKKENIQVNIGSTVTTATVLTVDKDVCRVALNQPVCCDIDEKVTISRRIDRNWRLIGWGKITRGNQVKLLQ